MSIAYVDIDTLRPNVYDAEWMPKHGRTMLALGYVRVSDLAAKGTEVGNAKSNAEQRRAYEKTCTTNRWTPQWFCDEGAASGSKDRHKRAAFDEAKRIIATGKVDVFHVWSSSRSARDIEVVFNELLPLLKRTNTRYSYGRRVYNPNDPRDRDAVLSDAMRDAEYARRISEDVSRAAVERAEAGNPHGRPAFGYRRIWVEGAEGDEPRNVCRDEHGDLLADALTVQWMFAQFLAGMSIVSMRETLNAERPMPVHIVKRGKMAGQPRGQHGWTNTQVRRILGNPSYAALREYNKHIVGPASWEPLVTLADYERARATLSARAAAHTRGNQRSSLLSGVAVCGVCGTRMIHGNSKRANGDPYYIYKCPDNSRHVAINAPRTDDIVIAAFVDGLPSLRNINPAPSPEAAELDDAIAALERNITTWRERMFAGRLDEDTAAEWSGVARAELVKLRAKRDEQAAEVSPWPSTVDALIDADDPLTMFAELTLEQRVAVLRACVTVTINRSAAKHGATFDTGRIDIQPVRS